MAASNYSVFRPKNVTSFKFGGTAWTSTQWAATDLSLASAYTVNQGTSLFDAIGARDANSPVQSEAFAKSISFGGNERDFSEENLLGSDTNSTQNQELGESAPSLQEVTLTCVYRNNVPASIFNDTTTVAMMQLDNSEGTGSGVVTLAFNNIKVTHVGSLSMNEDGLMEQTVKFKHKGGTTGSVVAVTSGAETWSKVTSADYAEEVRLT